jgi:hypothetical protein
MRKASLYCLASALAVVLALDAGAALASSHREAPYITQMPKVDNTDFYMFRSYEPTREGYVTFIANYQPFQDPVGGPNYFTMDPNAIYEIHIDNVGDAQDHITYQFQFSNYLRNGTGETLTVGGTTLPIALRVDGPVNFPNSPVTQGETEFFKVVKITGSGPNATKANITDATNGATLFRKPIDNIGFKTTADYAKYAQKFIYTVNIPGCGTPGRIFVGQREEAFAVNLGETFDLVNYIPIEGDSKPFAGDGKGFPGGITQHRTNDDLVGKQNVTSLAIEVPINCVKGSGNGVIGAYASASLPQARLLTPNPTYQKPSIQSGAFVEVSRLGMPLVNELVIGLPDKDLWNASYPSGDGQFLSYVTNPTFPAILNILFLAPVNATLGTNFPTLAPTNFPRNDLIATYLTGIKGLNQLSTVTPSEYTRLNTAVYPTPQATQQTYGVVADDLAGFPNGRRPGDDTVDITLRVAMGALCYPVPINGTPTNLGLCQPSDANVGQVPFTDGAPISARDLQGVFPYLNNPIPGSPITARVAIQNQQAIP